MKMQLKTLFDEMVVLHDLSVRQFTHKYIYL